MFVLAEGTLHSGGRSAMIMTARTQHGTDCQTCDDAGVGSDELRSSSSHVSGQDDCEDDDDDGDSAGDDSLANSDLDECPGADLNSCGMHCHTAVCLSFGSFIYVLQCRKLCVV